MRDRANRPNADEMTDRLDNVFTIPVQGSPPIKDGGTSCLQPGHPSYKPSLDLLRAARTEMKSSGFCGFDAALLGLVLTLRCAKVSRGDLTNYLGGVADVLESKDKRLRSENKLDHLGDLLGVSLYRDDRQIRDARVVLELGHPAPEYEVRLWRLSCTDVPTDRA